MRTKAFRSIALFAFVIIAGAGAYTCGGGGGDDVTNN